MIVKFELFRRKPIVKKLHTKSSASMKISVPANLTSFFNSFMAYCLVSESSSCSESSYGTLRHILTVQVFRLAEKSWVQACIWVIRGWYIHFGRSRNLYFMPASKVLTWARAGLPRTLTILATSIYYHTASLANFLGRLCILSLHLAIECWGTEISATYRLTVWEALCMEPTDLLSSSLLLVHGLDLWRNFKAMVQHRRLIIALVHQTEFGAAGLTWPSWDRYGVLGRSLIRILKKRRGPEIETYLDVYK